MRLKKGMAIFLLTLGAGAYGGSLYITTQVNIGEQQITDAQKKVKKADSLFSLSPYSKPLGDQLTGSAKKKIEAGQHEIDTYTRLAQALKQGALILSVLGASLFVYSFKK